MGDVIPEQPSPAPPPARMTFSLRANLLLLVVGVLLPVVAFSAFVVRRLAVQQRAVADRRLIQSARDFADSLDRETAGTIRSLAALAQSERLERGDFAAFHAEATRVLAAQPSWWSVILLDLDGHQLLNTLRPFGSLLASTADPESLRKTVQTGQPTVGSLVAGSSGHVLAFPVRVPVVYSGKLRYVLTAVIRPSDLAAAVGVTGDRPDEWVRSIVDTHGTVVARSRDPEKFIGKSGSADYLDSIRDVRDGLRRTSTMDGQNVYAAFSHARLSGWVAGVAVPVDVVNGPVTQSLVISAVPEEERNRTMGHISATRNAGFTLGGALASIMITAFGTGSYTVLVLGNAASFVLAVPVLLTIKERLFDTSHVTPACRANDTTDIHLPTGGTYGA